MKSAEGTFGTGAVLGVFSLTLMLSAALMFAVQPMVGKMLLPLVGGTPAGWIVAMAFFQVMLLLGYLLAHLFSSVSPLTHGLLYLGALCAGALFLPVALGNAGELFAVPGAWDVFRLLAAAVAVPFVALSATSSTIQRLFTLSRHASSGDPYFLYMASNLGSFAGLLLYPVLVEPLLPLDRQAAWLSGGYAILTAMGVACLALARAGMKSKPAKNKTPPKKARGLRLPEATRLAEWTALAFIPSALLMAVTAYITTDVISAPMIWIVPLALYLLTFVAAFSKRMATALAFTQKAWPLAALAAVFVISLMQAIWLSGWLGVFFYLAIFTLVALACHLRLAAARPLEDDSSHLTAYYLMMSVGGALGGVLNAFVVPYVFNRPVEFPLLLLAAFLLHPGFRLKSRAGAAFALLLALSAACVNLPAPRLGFDPMQARVALSVVACVAFFGLLPLFYRTLLKPQALALVALGVFMAAQFVVADTSVLASTRNFYGTIRVFERQQTDAEGKTHTLRKMLHGSTTHGTQVLDPRLETEPTAYHARKGPLGDAFEAFGPKRVAVLGLGIGVINCYARKDRTFTHIELDPAVVDVARKYFTFLSACPSKEPPRVIVGDGRLEMAKLGEDDIFDMIIMDAFTSDSIPTHLLTREALELYLERLAPNGVIAMNISNRFFKLQNAIAATAKAAGLRARVGGVSDLSKMPFYAANSLWMVLSREEEPLKRLPAPRWREAKPPEGLAPWTDNHTDLFSTLIASL